MVSLSELRVYSGVCCAIGCGTCIVIGCGTCIVIGCGTETYIPWHNNDGTQVWNPPSVPRVGTRTMQPPVAAAVAQGPCSQALVVSGGAAELPQGLQRRCRGRSRAPWSDTCRALPALRASCVACIMCCCLHHVPSWATPVCLEPEPFRLRLADLDLERSRDFDRPLLGDLDCEHFFDLDCF